MATVRRQGSVLLSDGSIHVWESDVKESDMKDQVVIRLAAFMKSFGWEFHVPYSDYDWLYEGEGRSKPKNRAHFAENSRKGMKDGLEIEIKLSGRHIEIKFWEDVTDHSKDNSNGGKHVFDKVSKMPYRQRCRYYATAKKIVWWFSEYHDYKIDFTRDPFQKKETAMSKILSSYTESWHKDEEIDVYSQEHAKSGSYGNDANGVQIKQGQIVYARYYDKGLICGRAFHNINNMWWVAVGKWDRRNIASFDIHTTKPEDFNLRVSERYSAKRLTSLVSASVKSKDFLRAHELQTQIEKLKASESQEVAG